MSEHRPPLPSPTERVGVRESKKITFGKKEKETRQEKQNRKENDGKRRENIVIQEKFLMTSANSRLENCYCRYAHKSGFNG